MFFSWKKGKKMNDFMIFMQHLNAVNSKDSKEIEWLIQIGHYNFLLENSGEKNNYQDFVSNLIVSYYELLLQPFIEVDKYRDVDKIAVPCSPEIQELLRNIIINDVWEVANNVKSNGYGADTVQDLVVIGLLILVNRYDLFETFKSIISDLSGFDLEESRDLVQIYEYLSVRYDNSSEDEKQTKQELAVDLIKILPLLSFELSEVSRTSTEVNFILSELSKSNHTKDYMVNKEKIKFYKVDSKEEKSRFNPRHLKTRLLVHGTKNKNMLSILEHGIDPNPKIIATGSSLGKGAYFAKLTQVGKSAQYCEDYLIVAEVAVGNRRYTSEIRNFREEILSAHTPYDSLHYKADSRSTFRNDELVVYRSEQIKVKYLIKLTN